MNNKVYLILISLIILINLSNSITALDYVANNGFSLSSTGARVANQREGYNITINQTFTLLNLTLKNSGVTATTAYLYNSTLGLIQTTTNKSGTTLYFVPVNLTANKNYLIVVDGGSGGAWNGAYNYGTISTYPIGNPYFNWTQGCYGTTAYTCTTTDAWHFNMIGLLYTSTTDITISNSTYNMTSDGGCTNWNSTSLGTCSTTDGTPTTTFNTNVAGSCSMSKTSQAAYNSSEACSTTGGTTHTCTLNSNNVLVYGVQSIYAMCTQVGINNATSGPLSINMTAGGGGGGTSCITNLGNAYFRPNTCTTFP